MPFINWSELPSNERLPGWNGRTFHSENMTFAYWDIAEDAVRLHEHHHPQEEVWHVVEGELVLTIDGVEHVAGPGCAAIVPPNTAHSARALSACKAIVADYPIRDDSGGVDAKD